MLLPRRPILAPWNICASELSDLGYGYPLWHPAPTKYGEVEIGDVGYILEGCFYRLFNATRSSDDPVNARGVPEGFVKLIVDEELRHRDPQFFSKGPICSKSTETRKFVVEADVTAPTLPAQAGGCYSFTVDGKRGAVIIFKDYGIQEQVLPCKAFEQYIYSFHLLWHAFAVKKGLKIRVEDIVLVSGWIKTAEWTLAAYSSERRSHKFAFTISASGSAAVQSSYAGSKSRIVMCTKSGSTAEASPTPQTSESNIAFHVSETPSDQCLFLRYYSCHHKGMGIINVQHNVTPQGRSAPKVAVNSYYFSMRAMSKWLNRFRVGGGNGAASHALVHTHSTDSDGKVGNSISNMEPAIITHPPPRVVIANRGGLDDDLVTDGQEEKDITAYLERAGHIIAGTSVHEARCLEGSPRLEALRDILSEPDLFSLYEDGPDANEGAIES